VEGQYIVPSHWLQSQVLDRCPGPAERHGARDWVVVKIEQIVRQARVFAA
jgi:hypothetical protein